jgi:hypothetical protein
MSRSTRARGLFGSGVFGLVIAASAACPEQAPNPPEGSLPCTSVGQRCQVSPGKLGSCVLIDNCGRDNCYVCQSQH